MSGFVTAASTYFLATGFTPATDDAVEFSPEGDVEVANEAPALVPVLAEEMEYSQEPPKAVLKFEGYPIAHSLLTRYSSRNPAQPEGREKRSIFDGIESLNPVTFIDIVLKQLFLGRVDRSRLPAILSCIPSILENESPEMMDRITHMMIGGLQDDAKREIDLFISDVLIREFFPSYYSAARRDMMIACTKHDVVFVRACATKELMEYIEDYLEDPDANQDRLNFVAPVIVALIELMKRETDQGIRDILLEGTDEETFNNDLRAFDNSPSVRRMQEIAADSEAVDSTTRGFNN